MPSFELHKECSSIVTVIAQAMAGKRQQSLTVNYTSQAETAEVFFPVPK